MPKRIVLVTYGSRGDVQPFLVLAKRLLQAGFAVRLLAPLMSGSSLVSDFQLAYTRRFEFIRLEGDIDLLTEELAQAGLNPIRSALVMSKFVLPLAARVYQLLAETSHDADAIVHSFLFTDGAHHIAQRMGVPDISVQFFPIFAPTRQYPAMSMPDLHLPGRLTGDYRRWSHIANTAIFRNGGRLLYAWLRREHRNLPALGAWPFDKPMAERPPLVFAFSPLVVPPDPAWPSNLHVSGYWFQDEAVDWQPPEDLQRFLAAGEPPFYIGFGSMVSSESGKGRAIQILQVVLDALENVPNGRAVLSLQDAHRWTDLPPNVMALPPAPHNWLLPRMAAVVHHGGAGTTAASLRAGAPTIIAPVMGDQSFWARRLVELGVGLALPPLRRLKPELLAQALVTALQDRSMRKQAGLLGEHIRAENGLGEMVQIIESVL
jgi:sterol 3beta-glucosyltransferase